MLREVRRHHAVPEADRPVLEGVTVQDCRQQRRLPGAVRPHEPDLLAALEDEGRAVQKELFAG